jgi:hypothetical protein
MPLWSYDRPATTITPHMFDVTIASAQLEKVNILLLKHGILISTTYENLNVDGN